ncbi:MAG: TlpA family protein disulfide reductase [Planctomycetaceae bacterium]|nr:TlpA family protein disulfide reductase [Planctomycetaceae bacterium]
MFRSFARPISGWTGRLAMGALTVAGLMFVWSARAEDEKPAKKGASAAAEKEEDPFALPKDASPAQLLRFIKKMQKYPAQSSGELEKMLAAIDQAADLVLKMKETDADDAETAARYKFMVYRTQVEHLEDKSALKRAEAFAKSLEADKRIPKQLAQEQMLTVRVSMMPQLKPDARKALIDEVFAYLEKQGADKSTAGMAIEFCDVVEQLTDAKQAAEVYSRLMKFLATSKDKDIAALSKKYEGVARRLNLPGNPLEVVGVTADGKPFDWKAYRGKVVLVDFWATWCGPCIKELPNVLANYKKYHSKGFEVVGISLDEDEDQLKEFLKERSIPWTTLFGKDEATRGWEHPMAVKYGIMGIPTVILVGKDGKVVNLEARGEKLGELLEQLLGDDK